MGVLSRKLFPACESLCVCCPALRSSSRQPVKRYKKLLAEIFPKSPDGSPSERKIVKLCEYAAKNPFRIPKIAKFLEERCYKELRGGHTKFITIVTEAYKKMLSICKEQMAYFAISLLNVINELLDKPKQEALLVLGCQALTSFIYNQPDGTYAHNIEKFVPKVCKLARDMDYDMGLRASSLQCLSAMVWFMAEFSYIFNSFDEIVYATLDNYKGHVQTEENSEGREAHHNWVDEVVRADGRCATAGADFSSSCIIIRQRPEKKDPARLTREEIETPKIWAQICVQKMVDLAKEGTTVRRVLDPMFNYFDFGQHWVPRPGLSLMVLSDMSYFLEKSGEQQLVLAAVIRHLDHKNVSHDVELKCHVIEVGTALARQVRSGSALADVALISDLCRHLRKSLQASVESVGQQELDVHHCLQNCIEDCLLEIAKGIGDAQPLLDLIAITLEKLPSSGAVACSTIRSLMILAHIMSISSSCTKQAFPEELLVQLLKAMLHPDVDVRVGAHQILSILLIPSSSHPRHQVASLRLRKWRSDNVSAFSSISALLEKLLKEKDGSRDNDNKVNQHVEEDLKLGSSTPINSPNFYKISTIIDRTTSLAELEPCAMKLSEDQVAQLLSAFWIQANLPDNMPSNIEAIAHSFALTLISLKNPNDNLVVRFFQLPLSLRSSSLDIGNGMLPPSCQRSVFVLSTGMLMFAAKMYQIPELYNLLKTSVPNDIDPFLGISEDLQVYVKPHVDVRGYGSASDNQLASCLLCELRSRLFEHDLAEMDILVGKLSSLTEMKVEDLARQLSERFTPDDAFIFGPPSLPDFDQKYLSSLSKESLSFDEEVPTSSLLEDGATSEASVGDISRFVPKIPSSPSVSHVISIGQLLESALEVAGRVAGTSVSTSPLPYDTLAKQCEALGNGTRKKLSNWLAHENQCGRLSNNVSPEIPSDLPLTPWKVCSTTAAEGLMKQWDPCLAMRLPPASPFDNFLKAAGC